MTFPWLEMLGSLLSVVAAALINGARSAGVTPQHVGIAAGHALREFARPVTVGGPLPVPDPLDEQGQEHQ